MMDEFSKTVGDYGMQSISTRPHRGIGINESGNFLNLSNGKASAGYVVEVFGNDFACDLRVASKYLRCPIDFKAVAGHELIHASHIYHFGYSAITTYLKNYTEYWAYRYTINVYLNAGRSNSAWHYSVSSLMFW